VPERQRRPMRKDEGSRGGSGLCLRGRCDPSPGRFAPTLPRRGRGLPGGSFSPCGRRRDPHAGASAQAHAGG